ncbi:metallophosphoesterase family protein [Vagococcus fessus]|uniref:Calcineurin-like phosphoesterase domain-containing protein n=1 Tax=Vagococcus fessus TaxID=120370 RepID=A0A430A869_9ENTE|nr:DNA repair exonuclease [Vagococcus fessus]RSU03323.1 hypothetical protein CBF31_06300 [Vagococcus fessus]
MKILHVADLHMDQAFEGLGKLPRKVREKLANENLNAWKNTVALAIEKDVDLVVIVGDTFHQSVISVNSQHHFINGLKRLEQYDIPTVLTFGNHDYYAPEKYWFDFPNNVHIIISEEIETVDVRLKTGELVSVSGFSYQSKWLSDNKGKKFPVKSIDSTYHIGLYHGQLQSGNVDTDRYAPFNLAELKEKGYDYWALGHIHQPQFISEEPLMVYPGSPIGHTRKEINSRGVVIVGMTGKEVSLEWLPVAKIAWQKVSISLKYARTLSECLVETEEQFNNVSWKGENITFALLEWCDIPEQLRQEISKELEQLEVLSYLQEQLYKLSNEQVWLVSLSQETLIDRLTLPLGLSAQAIQDEIVAFNTEEKFNQTVLDLLKQPELRQILEQDSRFKEAVFYETYQQLLNDLGGRGAAKYEN